MTDAREERAILHIVKKAELYQCFNTLTDTNGDNYYDNYNNDINN